MPKSKSAEFVRINLQSPRMVISPFPSLPLTCLRSNATRHSAPLRTHDRASSGAAAVHEARISWCAGSGREVGRATERWSGVGEIRVPAASDGSGLSLGGAECRVHTAGERACCWLSEAALWILCCRCHSLLCLGLPMESRFRDGVCFQLMDAGNAALDSWSQATIFFVWIYVYRLAGTTRGCVPETSAGGHCCPLACYLIWFATKILGYFKRWLECLGGLVCGITLFTLLKE